MDWRQDLPPGLAACSNALVPVKSNKIRSVYKAACDNGEAFFIKHLYGLRVELLEEREADA